MHFRVFTEIFDYNPWFLILASNGQPLTPATASYGLANLMTWPDAWRTSRCEYSYCTVRNTLQWRDYSAREFITTLKADEDNYNVLIKVVRY